MRAFVRRHAIFEPGPVVVACSGGADSLALVGILDALADELGLVLHVAHFDHRMRASSARDAALVERVARERRLPAHVGTAARPPRSEGEAREARYRFLRGVAAQTGARAIALGHTRDDQAETVLLHLVRGSGVVGLAAMRPRRDDLARPLLCLSRAETETYVASSGVRPARDASNRDLRYARNRIRLRVLPALERINPKAREALARVAENAAALADVLQSRADQALREAGGVPRDGALAIDLDRLAADEATRSEALALGAERAGVPTLSERHRRALLELSRDTSGSARLDLPRGHEAVREYATLRIGNREAEALPPAAVRLERGRLTPWGGWTFLLAGETPRGEPLPLRAWVAGEPLEVRAWRPGDRLAGGPAGRKKVQDVLTNAKVPRRSRPQYPVVIAAGGAVVWVPGLTEAAAEGAEGGLELRASPPRAGRA